METMGDKLKKLRIEKDLSLSELAKQVGVPKSNISKYENNLRLPGSDNLKKLALYFNVDADYLLGLNKNDDVKMHIFEILKKRGIVNSLDEELSEEQMSEIKDLFDKALGIYNMGKK